jgi:rhodanese-related sulfurtransferase
MQYIQFFLQHWVLSGGIVLILLALLWLELKGKVLGASRVSATQAVQLINRQNAKVFDIRDRGAFNAGHIINALSVSKQDISDEVKKIQGYKKQPVIVVCANGTTASTISQQLHKQGFEQVHFLQGGINAWKSDNLPLEKE